MKRTLLTMLITSAIMATLLGSILVFSTRLQQSKQAQAETKSLQEKDIKTDGVSKVEIDKDNVIPLYIKGNKKNVITYSTPDIKQVYKEQYSSEIADKLEQEKKKGDRRLNKPLWALNPYGTSPLSLYLYYKTREDSYLTYTISVEDNTIPDFTRTLYNGKEDNVTKEHEYQLFGFIPGKKNYIILTSYDTKGNQIESVTYSIEMEDVPDGVQTKLKTTRGIRQTALSNGLFYLLGKDINNKKAMKAIFIYDNSGFLRGYMPLIEYRSDRMMFINDSMVYSFSKSGIAAVSRTGQVLKTYNLGIYSMHHDYVYDGFANLYLLVSDNTTDYIEDIVITLNLETGKVKKVLDMKKIIPAMQKKAVMPAGDTKLDWVHLNSLQLVDGNSLIVSSRELSSIFRIDKIGTKKPTLNYIIAEPGIWKNTPYEKKVLNKAGDNFKAQFGQHTVVYETNNKLPEGQYYLCMFNNNFGSSPTRADYDWAKFKKNVGRRGEPADNSYYYKYLVDETNNVYQLVKTIDVPYSFIVGSIQDYEENFVINSGAKKVFGEYNAEGELITQYKTNIKFYNYRVFKYDMKDFWFK